MLNTLKEIIQNTDTINQSIRGIIGDLFKCSENTDESLKNIVAECIGKICLINVSEMKQHIL